MGVVFAMLLFFGGPLVLLIGLIKPTLYRGSRWRALFLGVAVSAFGFAGALFMMPESEWQAARERTEQRRAEREAEARAQEQQRAERAASEARALEEQRKAEERRAADERARRAAEAARPRGPDQLRAYGGASTVFVWRDGTALNEAYRLIDAGVHRTNPALIMPLVACVATPGTQIVVTDSGWTRSTILIVAGQMSGCRGVVANEWIDRGR